MRYRLSRNVISRHFQEHSSIYTFIMVLFLMGVIFGAVIVNSLSVQQKDDLFYYLQQFFGQVQQGEVMSPEELLKLSLVDNIKMTGLIWLLGISIIGFPLIFVLLFLKGVVVGFSVGFLVNQMGWSGLLLSFVSLLPQNLLMIPAFIFITVCSISFSMTLIRKVLIRQTIQFQFVPALARYFLMYIGVIAVITIAASIEAFVTPVLMKTILMNIAKS